MSVSQDALPYKEPRSQLTASYTSINTPSYSEGPARSTGLDAKYTLNSVVRDERKNTCLIINIEEFDTKQARSGASEDTRIISTLFEDLGFTCIMAEAADGSTKRLTIADIDRSIKAVKERVDKDSDIFVCWIMSHGKRGHIVDSEQEEILLDDIIKEFTEEGCEKLKGKPKLFFVQACQSPGSKEEAEKCWDYDITPYADFFVGFSTPAGFVSYRDVHEGSFYTRAMNEVFRSCLERSSSVDFTRVMTLVANNVALKYRAISEEVEVLQMPCYVSSLTKRIFLSKAAPRTAV